MSILRKRLLLASALALAAAGCATVPPGPPPDVVRLQNDLDRLHSDPRIATNGGVELANADAAVDVLARSARALPPRDYRQGVYIADKLIGIAEACALARDAEHRGMQLGAERERLLARAGTRETTTVISHEVPEPLVHDEAAGEPVPASRAELLAMQGELSGLESRVDSRGLVVSVGGFLFDPARPTLTPEGETSLDSLARALRRDPDAQADIWADDTARAASVRDYLNARGVDLARLDLRGTTAGPGGGRRVDVVIRTEMR